MLISIRYILKEMMNDKKVLLIIPAYNEHLNIEATVEKVRRMLPQCDYIVINDGSTDGTDRICRSHGYKMLDLPVNVGLGGAFRTGMKYAKRNDYDYAIQFDADGQHKAEYIDKMLSLAEKEGYDIVIGSRFTEGHKTLSMRGIGSRIISFFIKISTGIRIDDVTSGMRLYGKRMIDLFADVKNLYPEPDTIAYLINCGIKVGECGVTMRERQFGKSYLGVSKSIAYMFHMSVSILVMQWFRKRRNVF